jgi:hypothetical protein
MTQLTSEVINIITTLNNLQSEKNILKNRLKDYENKVLLIKEGELDLASKEQDLIIKLNDLGYVYSTTGIYKKDEQPSHTSYNGGQLDSLIQILKSPISEPPPPISTSQLENIVQLLQNNNVYHFPQSNSSPSSPYISRTPSVTKMSPTSGNGVSIRRK